MLNRLSQARHERIWQATSLWTRRFIGSDFPAVEFLDGVGQVPLADDAKHALRRLSEEGGQAEAIPRVQRVAAWLRVENLAEARG